MSEKMVVPLDFSDATDGVLATAEKLARSLGLSVTLIHVAQKETDFIGYEVGPEYIRDHVAEDLRDQHQQLETCCRKLTDSGLEAVALLVPGDPAEKLVQEIERLAPAMVVIGSHGHGALHQLLAGSACQAVLQHATCPVVVVPSRSAGK